MAYYPVTDLVLIDNFLKIYKPKCSSCDREMLPIGPEEYFCNFDPCVRYNMHTRLAIYVEHQLKGCEDVLSKQTSSKKTKKTKKNES